MSIIVEIIQSFRFKRLAFTIKISICWSVTDQQQANASYKVRLVN